MPAMRPGRIFETVLYAEDLAAAEQFIAMLWVWKLSDGATWLWFSAVVVEFC